MRDEDFRREYLGEWPPYPEAGYYKDAFITIRLIDKIEDCGLCPLSIYCVAGKPIAQSRMGPGFLCSRCACYHQWWDEERTHVVCGLLRFGTHAASDQSDASGVDHGLVALYGQRADRSASVHEKIEQYDAPCAGAWNEHDLVVPMHPCGDGHSKYNRNQPRQSYARVVDPYDCIAYFTGHAPIDFPSRGIPVIDPISPFQGQSVADKVGTHGRRRMRGRYCL